MIEIKKNNEIEQKGFCEKCGSPVILVEVSKGTHSKYPDFFDRATGKRWFHKVFRCMKGNFWNCGFDGHTERFVDFISSEI